MEASADESVHFCSAKQCPWGHGIWSFYVKEVVKNVGKLITSSTLRLSPVVTERRWFDFVSGHCAKDYSLTNTDAPA
jgi:hypothetical protein